MPLQAHAWTWQFACVHTYAWHTPHTHNKSHVKGKRKGREDVRCAVRQSIIQSHFVSPVLRGPLFFTQVHDLVGL